MILSRKRNCEVVHITFFGHICKQKRIEPINKNDLNSCLLQGCKATNTWCHGRLAMQLKGVPAMHAVIRYPQLDFTTTCWLYVLFLFTTSTKVRGVFNLKNYYSVNKTSGWKTVYKGWICTNFSVYFHIFRLNIISKLHSRQFSQSNLTFQLHFPV